MPVWTPAGNFGYGDDGNCDEHPGWPGADALTNRCGLIMWGGCLLLFVTHYIIRSLLRKHWTSFTLTEVSQKAGVTRETNLCDATREIQSIAVSSVLGPMGAYLAWHSVSTFDNPALHTIVLHAEVRPESCEIALWLCTLGAIFGAWTVYQFSWLMLGWQSGLENYVHHTLFCVVSVLNPYSFCVFEATLFALAMEISSPALSTMLIFRQVRGTIVTRFGSLDYSQIETGAALIFMPLFLISRVFMFGYALWRSLQVWVVRPGIVLSTLGERTTFVCCVQGVYLAGWGLQLFWARVIVKKFLRKFGGKLKVN